MVVASLIATMASQVVRTPPVGIYLISNKVGLVGSLSIILLLITGLPFCRKFLMLILIVILWMTITTMTITYLISIVVATPIHDYSKLRDLEVSNKLGWSHMVKKPNHHHEKKIKKTKQQ
ncbi:hypothetical protein G4B88_011545 [Cannabis sativa]|uniref:Uncharacterized protein n=1 Tax=Cannabis sativa TaxID=3483 RepID=A0A7J6GGX8_CANSA|nr:hypothetical protein G4B88_011545 [Cannabis sativa]